MSQQNIELAQRAVAAFNRGDGEAVLEMLSPEVEIFAARSLANGGAFRGHDGYLEWIAAWLDAWETFRVEMEDDFSTADDDVVVSAHQYGRGKGSGVEVEMPIAYLFTIRDGKALRLHLYPSKAEALEAAGMADQEGAGQP
jgi:ketosteroid isomerase-like protein